MTVSRHNERDLSNVLLSY